MRKQEKKDSKKLVYAGIIVLVLSAATARQVSATPDSNSIVVDNVEFYIQADKSIYYLGENVQMLYRMTYLGPFFKTEIWCYQTPPFNIFLEKDGEVIWMKYRFFLQEFTVVNLWRYLPPEEITSDWNMTDFNDVLVEPGTYEVTGIMYNAPWNYENGRGYVSTEVRVPITILSEPLCGDLLHPYPVGDLNNDCRVDLFDVAILLSHWLECTDPECD